MKHKKDTAELRRKLRKLMAMAMDTRGNKHVQDRSMELAHRLAKQAGIDLKSIEHDFNYDDFNVAESELREHNLTFDHHILGMLINEFWGVRVDGIEYLRGRAKAKFLARKPQNPDKAKSAFDFIYNELAGQWNIFKVMRDRALKNHSPFSFLTMAAGKIAAPKPANRKSFYAGFYRSFRERLLQEREGQKRISMWEHTPDTMLAEPPPRQPIGELEPGEPWIAPPPNPLAIMCLRKPAPPKAEEPIAEEPDTPEPAPENSKPPLPNEFDQTSFNSGYRLGQNLDIPI